MSRNITTSSSQDASSHLLDFCKFHSCRSSSAFWFGRERESNLEVGNGRSSWLPHAERLRLPAADRLPRVTCGRIPYPEGTPYRARMQSSIEASRRADHYRRNVFYCFFRDATYDSIRNWSSLRVCIEYGIVAEPHMAQECDPTEQHTRIWTICIINLPQGFVSILAPLLNL